MLKVGLTGGIGSGKTAVSTLFHDLNINIIDTDVIARELITHDKITIDKVIQSFGLDIQNNDNSINRKKLAHIVFTDNNKKSSLEKILHPKIRAEVNQKIDELSSQPSPPVYIIVVIPLLIETGFNDLIDRTLVVMANENSRIERVINRDNRKPDEIRSIISSQTSDKERNLAADDIIDNNRDIKHLHMQVKQLNQKYSQI